MKIIYEDDTELADFEAENKGYRKDVIVEIDGKRYRLYITDITRLQQDFEDEYCNSKFYSQEPNTIIVNSVTREEISFVINELSKGDYFKRLDRNGFDIF
ncbi:MAG: hypothetical protein J5965_06995 [Aeriscardovia sp.]|nr:hypothetical protein [Aeriscardovia sp.]MBP3283552.1 hypothetical protein [Treponema sp.]